MFHNIAYTDLARFCEMVTARMGLDFPVERWPMLYANLTSAAPEFGFKDVNKFMQWLLSENLKLDQIEILASYLTISETYFWREAQTFAAFCQFTLPEIMALKKEKGKSISIWCAACSTGEEAYSLAIALHRTIPHVEDWNITITATDINNKVLSKARKGVYSSWSFRNAPVWLQTKYFKSHNNREYRIIPEIKKMVTFSSFNLTHENFLSSVCRNQKMDIIFCRNVLMYFTSDWAAKISQNLYHSLSENGWLAVASCELSSSLFPHLIPVNFAGAVLYRKNKKETSGLKVPAMNTKTQTYNSTYSPSIPLSFEGKQLFEVGSASDLMKEDLYHKIDSPDRKESLMHSIREPLPGIKSREDILIENKNSIRLLANQGRLEEAHSICNDAIESDKLAPSLYFLRASILQELDNNPEAIKSLKQAIFIDPNYLMGHFTLGNLFVSQGNTKNAKRYFSNALDLLNTLSKDEILSESEGLSAEYLREIILSNLHTQKSK